MNTLGVSSMSSEALTGLASFDLVPRKLERPCAVEGITNVMES